MKTLPRKKERNWSKVFVIIAGIAFVLLFVGTYFMTLLNGTFFSPKIQGGETVLIGLTIRDEKNRPILTTSQQVYSDALTQGFQVFFTPQPTVIANKTYNESLVGVDAYAPQMQWVKFGLFGPEMERITNSLVGMREGETKTIDLTSFLSSTRKMTIEQFEGIGGNYNSTQEGDQIVLGFTQQPTIPVGGSNTTPSYFSRTMEVVNKSSDGVTVSYWYSSAEITINKVTSK